MLEYRIHRELMTFRSVIRSGEVIGLFPCSLSSISISYIASR